MRRVALAFLLASCDVEKVYVQEFEVPGQADAMAIVWNETFRRVDAAPHIVWMRGEMLACMSDGKLGFVIYLSSERRCIRGRAWSPDEIEVAWTGDEKFSETSLAYAAMRAAALRGDTTARELVDQANETLASRNY